MAKHYLVVCALLAVFPAFAPAQDADSIRVIERGAIALQAPEAGAATHSLSVTLAYFKDSGWSAETIVPAIAQAGGLLAQCGVRIGRAELVVVDAPRRYHWFDTPISREVARVLRLAKPTIYFVADTRQQPAFDAEAIGRGNSRSRPELADTVWVTRATRHLGVALAHELAHVLLDSGAHSVEPGNLMQEETAPENTLLSAAQCARLRQTASANGMLQPN